MAMTVAQTVSTCVMDSTIDALMIFAAAGPAKELQAQEGYN
jgi:hypothetical protein